MTTIPCTPTHLYRPDLAAALRSTLLVFLLANSSCQADMASVESANDMLVQQTTGVEMETIGTDDQCPMASLAVEESPCHFITREVVVDTVIECCYLPCPGGNPFNCPFNGPWLADTIITVDTIEHKVDVYNGAVYRYPTRLLPNGSQVVDMQPDSLVYDPELDLIRWTCDEGYEAIPSLSIPSSEEEWATRLYLDHDPEWNFEWVVAHFGGVEQPIGFARVGLQLIDAVELIPIGSASLFVEIRERR